MFEKTKNRINAAKKRMIEKAKETWRKTKKVAPAAAIAAASLSPTSAQAQTQNGNYNSSVRTAQTLNHAYAHNNGFHFQATGDAPEISRSSSNGGNQGRTYTTTAADYQQVSSQRVVTLSPVEKWLSEHPQWEIDPELTAALDHRPREGVPSGYAIVCRSTIPGHEGDAIVVPNDPSDGCLTGYRKSFYNDLYNRRGLFKYGGYYAGGYGYAPRSGGHVSVDVGPGGAGVRVGGVGRNGAGGASVSVGRNGASVSVGGTGRGGSGGVTVAVNNRGGIHIGGGISRY